MTNKGGIARAERRFLFCQIRSVRVLALLLPRSLIHTIASKESKQASEAWWSDAYMSHALRHSTEILKP